MLQQQLYHMTVIATILSPLCVQLLFHLQPMRTKSENHPLVITLPNGDFELGILGLGLGDLNPQSPILKAPIPNSK